MNCKRVLLSFVLIVACLLFVLGTAVEVAFAGEDWQERIVIHEDGFDRGAGDQPRDNFYFGMAEEPRQTGSPGPMTTRSSSSLHWEAEESDLFHYETEITEEYTWQTVVDLRVSDDNNPGEVEPEIIWGKESDEAMGNIPDYFDVTMDLKDRHAEEIVAEGIDLTEAGSFAWEDPELISLRRRPDQALLAVTIEVERNDIFDLDYKVTDEQGEALEGAEVVLDDYEGKTDLEGELTFADLQADKYSFSVAREGYEDVKESVQLEGDMKQEITLTEVEDTEPELVENPGFEEIQRPFAGEMISTGDALEVKSLYDGNKGDTVAINFADELSKKVPVQENNKMQKLDASLESDSLEPGEYPVKFEYLAAGGVISSDSRVITVTEQEVETAEGEKVSFNNNSLKLSFADSATVSVTPYNGSNVQGMSGEETVQLSGESGNNRRKLIENSAYEIKASAAESPELTISYEHVAENLDPAEEESLKLYRLNDDGQSWSDEAVRTQEINTDEQTVTAELEHFSVYALLVETADAYEEDYVYSWPNPYRAPDEDDGIKFELPEEFGNNGGEVTLEVYNINGQRLVEKSLDINGYQAEWKDPDLASGSYIYVIEGNGETCSDKFAIIR